MTDQQQIAAILEILQFMQENMMTKEDAKNFITKEDARIFATKDDLQAMESRMLEHIDGLAQQTQKFDHELVAAQSKFNRLEERVEVLEEKVGIAA